MNDNAKASIGIITVHYSTNVGAILQAYALQTVVERLGLRAEIIDHNRFVTKPSKAENRTKVKKTKRSIPVLFSQIKGLAAVYKDAPLKKEACDLFRNRYLHISSRKYTEINEIQEDPPIYSGYICGSDQIWNPERFQSSAPFFLSFAPEKSVKISYAPSLGVSDIPESMHLDYKRLINRLDFVSVREKSGAKLISSITGRDVKSVLDPTFLLDSEDYAAIASKDRLIHGKYVFCYFLNYMSAYRIRKELNAFARNNGLKVLMFQAKCTAIDPEWIPAYGLGPSEFLSAIQNANLVVTDSFHGTALSIKLEKPFFVYNAESDLPFASRFDRISNLLDKCSLNNRVLDIGQPVADIEIDYKNVNSLLQHEIFNSISFLQNALSAVNHREIPIEAFNLPYNKNSCFGCGLCSYVCPANALKIELDSDGFYRPAYEKGLCIHCGRCENGCPAINSPSLSDGLLKECYAAWNLDKTIQKTSSSGGIFSVIAKEIIQSGGIVVGASVSPDLSVRHISVDNSDELYKCRGSKYAQSLMGDIYPVIAEALKQNRYVLFTGTGCQVAAIRSCFGERENLVLCDVVCHGVGSPGIFADYLHNIEQTTSKEVSSFNFRDESRGWNKPCVKIDFKDGSEDKHRWYKDEYIRAFSKNRILRSSCFDCKYSSFPRMSDITIADFWGAKKVGAIYNKNGTSLVIINNAKGKNLFERIKINLQFKPVVFNDAIRFNRSAVSSSKKPDDRDTLFYHYKNDGFEYIRKKYLRVPGLPEKIINKLKHFLEQ
ncbi:MAG: polysaccharide pyruvyl transferase family protein [Clostridia bacterium]|nr:polysaccharide pyruvyl transferase family protein [Clostridia bacterium]